MGTKVRAIAIVAFAATPALGACSSSSKPSVPTATTTSTTTAASTTTPSGPVSTATVPSPSEVPPTTGFSRPVNLTTTDEVRAALVAAFGAGQHLEPRYVAGTVKGSVYYAYDPAPRLYWAMAEFTPTQAARDADKRLNGAQGDPLIQFQDGPWIFSRSAATPWRLIGDTGGRVCPPRPPASVFALWGNQSPECN